MQASMYFVSFTHKTFCPCQSLFQMNHKLFYCIEARKYFDSTTNNRTFAPK